MTWAIVNEDYNSSRVEDNSTLFLLAQVELRNFLPITRIELIAKIDKPNIQLKVVFN